MRNQNTGNAPPYRRKARPRPPDGEDRERIPAEEQPLGKHERRENAPSPRRPRPSLYDTVPFVKEDIESGDELYALEIDESLDGDDYASASAYESEEDGAYSDAEEQYPDESEELSEEDAYSEEYGEEAYAEGYEESGEDYAAPQDELPPEEEPSPKKRKKVKAGGGGAKGLYGRVITALAVRRYRKETDRSLLEPDIEDADTAMPPRRAAKLYASQIPAFKHRAKLALIVSLLPLWIAFGSCGLLPLPGALASDLRAAAIVSAVSMLAVMLLGLDVFTSGILSFFRGRPGAETLIAFACLASCADTLILILSEKAPLTLPPCASVCFSMVFALRGALQTCRANKAGFYALSKADDPFTVTGEKILKRKELFLIKSRQNTDEFIRRSEEPDCCERLSAESAPFCMILSLCLALLLSLGEQGLESLPHSLAMLTAVCAPWCSFGIYPMLYARTAQSLMKNGTAVAGWRGVKDVGSAKHLILTDSDLFPKGTVAVSGVRILEGAFTEQVVSFTGSVLAAAGIELASLFTDMMKKSGGTLRTVENFGVGEGGAQALIEGTEVLVGRAGYMYLHGIRIPPRLVSADAIYTAFNGTLVGFFGISYTPVPAIGAALRILHKNKRKPIFAARDFNVDPEMIKAKFHSEVTGFEFPPVAERIEIAEVPASGKNPAAAVISGGGLERLVELADKGRFLYRTGRFCALMTLLCPAIGMIALFALGWTGFASAVTVVRLLLYMLVWLLPGFVLAPSAG